MFAFPFSQGAANRKTEGNSTADDANFPDNKARGFPNPKNPRNPSIPLKVIHETPDLLYAADSKGGAAARWREWEIPNIIVLRTDSVAERILLPADDAQ